MQGVCLRLEQVASIRSEDQNDLIILGVIKFLQDIESNLKGDAQVMAQKVLNRLDVTNKCPHVSVRIAGSTTPVHQKYASKYRLKPVWDNYWYSCINSSLLKAAQADLKNTPISITMDEINGILMDQYLSQLTIRCVSGELLDLESCYFNLAIAKEKCQRKPCKQGLKKQSEKFIRMPSYEEVFYTNTENLISLHEILDKRMLLDGREGVPKRILIIGRAGVGKSTLCKKFVHTFQQGHWNDRLDTVLWLPLRLLKGYKSRNLKDLLIEKYFIKESENIKEGLACEFIKSASDGRVLFLLDGLDEFVTEMNTEEGDTLRSFIVSLLKQPNLIVTTRPYGNDRSLLHNLDLELETIGFSTENVEQHIKKAIKNPSDAKSVIDFIQQTPLVQGLVNIPVQLDLICYCWDDIVSGNGSTTITQIYQKIIRKLRNKDTIRMRMDIDKEVPTELQTKGFSSDVVDENVGLIVEFLGYLAFRGLQNQHQLIFDQDALLKIFQEYCQHRKQTGLPELSPILLAEIKMSSILHNTEFKIGSGFDTSGITWNFIHLTFQEYLAATWLSKYFLGAKSNSSTTSKMVNGDDMISFIQNNKYNPRYEIVWQMIAGQLEGEALESYFRLLQDAPRDLIGVRHYLLLARCYKEAQPRLSPVYISRLQCQLSKWLLSEVSILYFQYNGDISGTQSVFTEEGQVKSISTINTTQISIPRTPYYREYLTSTTIQRLMQMMNDVDPEIVKLTIMVLNLPSTSPETITTAPVTDFLDEDSEVTEQLILPEFTVTKLIASLQGTDSKIREAAAYALSNQSTLSEFTVMALVTALQDEDSHVRRAAAHALGNQSKLSDPPIAALVASLQDQDSYIRRVAVNALGGQSKPLESTIMALVATLQDEDFYVRRLSANALGGQSTMSESTITALVNTLLDEVPLVRRVAANVLGEHPTLSESTITALVTALQDEDSLVRSLTVNTLGKQSILSDSTITALVTCLHDDIPDVRVAAANALGKHHLLSEHTIAAIIAALKDDDSSVRGEAINALGSQSTILESTFNALVASLQDKDSNVRRIAVTSLAMQPTLSESIIAALIISLKDEDPSVRSVAASVLGRQSILPESIITALITSLQDKYSDVRRAVVDALGKQPILPESAISAIVSALLDEDSLVRRTAVYALGKQSKLSGSTATELVSALRYDNSIVQYLLDAVDIQKICLSIIYLSESDIEFLHRHVLLDYCLNQYLSLYIHENRLQYYTEQGLGQSNILCSQDLKRIKSSFLT